MNNNFYKTQLPNKNWKLINVYDVREDGQSAENTIYETCMICNNEKIRYVHVIIHEKVDNEFLVGCICAEKMTNDYINPKKLENELKNKANKKNNFIKRNWKLTENGNYKLNYEGHSLLIFFDKRIKKFKCKIDNQFGIHSFNKIIDAKLAIYKGVEYYKLKNLWD